MHDSIQTKESGKVAMDTQLIEGQLILTRTADLRYKLQVEGQPPLTEEANQFVRKGTSSGLKPNSTASFFQHPELARVSCVSGSSGHPVSRRISPRTLE